MVSPSQKIWRDRQRRVLTGLRKESGSNRSRIAERAGLEYWQLTRLETGRAELPAKLIPALAHAYGTEPQALIDRLGLTENDAQWDHYRAELVASGASPDQANQILRDSERIDPPARHDYLVSVITTLKQMSRSAHSAPARPKRRERHAM